MADGRRGSRLRRFLPWCIGIAIIVVIATQVPFAKFKASLSSGPHLRMAATEIGIATIVLFTDTFATWLALIALGVQWGVKRVLAIRGATYLLVLLNYAVGQGGFGYYLYRSGMSALRALGSTLFILGTNLATLLTMTFAIWLVAGARGDVHEGMWWTLMIVMGAFALYLAIIATRIGLLARREMLNPLFDAGLRGHAIAITARLPHIAMVVLGYWIPMRVWGIPVPFETALVFAPAVALAAVLPISPAGLGTTQAALVYFFAAFAPGATSDERQANLLAFGVVHFVYSVIGTTIVGLACMFFARRAGIITQDEAKPE
jgi:hypothetical protein